MSLPTYIPVEDKLPLLQTVAVVASQAGYVREAIRGGYRGARNPLVGLCYTMSEAAYHLCDELLEPMWVRFGKQDDATHWYLRRASNGEVVDITASQFPAKDFFAMYEVGQRRAFGTALPSRRARMVLDRVDRDYVHFRRFRPDGGLEFKKQLVVSTPEDWKRLAGY